MTQSPRSSRTGRYRSTPSHHGGRTAPRRPGLPLATVLVLDVLAVGLCLIVFALFHHVLPGMLQGEVTGQPLPTAAPTLTPTATPQSTPAATDDPAQTAAPTEPPRVYSGVWGEKFAAHFTIGEVIQDETSYRSENISITYETVQRDGIIYHVADVYISDLKYLRSGFAGGTYKLNTTAFVSDQCKENNAVVAISGDQYGMRQEGIVVRNGMLYRDTRFKDIAVLYNDGVLETYENGEFDLNTAAARGIYQVWSFGPELLNNGTPLESFNTDVGGKNPRAAIGYVEPGHYYLMQVDGRIDESRGMTMTELAQLFADLGCVSAYNMDGGQTAAMAWQGELVSHPYGRKATDCIYITDFPPAE